MDLCFGRFLTRIFFWILALNRPKQVYKFGFMFWTVFGTNPFLDSGVKPYKADLHVWIGVLDVFLPVLTFKLPGLSVSTVVSFSIFYLLAETNGLHILFRIWNRQHNFFFLITVLRDLLG